MALTLNERAFAAALRSFADYAGVPGVVGEHEIIHPDDPWLAAL